MVNGRPVPVRAATVPGSSSTGSADTAAAASAARAIQYAQGDGEDGGTGPSSAQIIDTLEDDAGAVSPQMDMYYLTDIAAGTDDKAVRDCALAHPHMTASMLISITADQSNSRPLREAAKEAIGERFADLERMRATPRWQFETQQTVEAWRGVPWDPKQAADDCDRTINSFKEFLAQAGEPPLSEEDADALRSDQMAWIGRVMLKYANPS